MTYLDDLYAARLRTRLQWGARRAESVTRFVPDFGTTEHYEGVNLGDYPHTSCDSKVRGIQSYHMDAKNWVDVAYNALVCRHGLIYEGRPIGVRTAANGTNEGNDSAHAVCGLFGPTDSITADMLEGMAIASAWLNQPTAYGDGINGHRDWKSTTCPDDDLYAQLGWLRQRQAELRAGAPSTPLPPAVIGPHLLEDTLRQYLIPVPISSNRGYADLRAGFAGLPETISPSRVVGSPCFAGDNPSDGWGPSNRRAVELVNVGGVARVVVPEHDVVSGHVSVYVTVADVG